MIKILFFIVLVWLFLIVFNSLFFIFFDYVNWSIFGFVENPADVFADDADGDELNAAQEKDCYYQSGETLHIFATDECFYNDEYHVQESGYRDEEP